MKAKLTSLIAIMALGCGTMTGAVDYTPNYQVVENANYPTTDVVVATYNILDFKADANRGEVDVTSTVQTLLDKLGDAGKYPEGESQAYRRTGGTLYLPAGKYLFKGKIVIPRGVTIRGDWKKPVPGQPIEGTILCVGNKYKGDTNESNSFIVMEPSTQVQDLAIWYTDQDAANPTPYPPTITYGKRGYFGNDYCNTRNVTIVNSWIGIQFSEFNGGGCPNIFGFYGTPLSKGVAMDNIADVGRFDHIDFSPKYWAGSGLDNAGDATAWTYANATGFEMRRNDWSYCCNYSAEGYARGFWAKRSPDTMVNQSTGSPNGQNYNLTFTNCATGVYVTESANAGCMFTRVKTPGCRIGLEQAPGVAGPGQYLDCDFYGSAYGVLMHETTSNAVQMELCRVTGGVEVKGGQFMADNCTFDGDVNIGALARCVMTANTLKNGSQINNNSLYVSIVDNTPRAVPAVPAYDTKYMEVPVTKPAKNTLFVATNYGAVGEYITKDVATCADNSAAIQKALDAAKANGGGIVYLPAGHYRCNANLTIPAGVELRGASDIASVARGQGAVLEVMVGKGQENGTPFITMEPQSGLRGVTINYPEQNEEIFSAVQGTGANRYRVCTPHKYPYAVRGNKDTYVVNLALRTCYQGVDMFTNKCDNHYVDYISGHSFKNVIRVGGNSENGTVSNIQCNTIAFAAGDEWKFGLWPNSLCCKDDLISRACYQQNYDELEFMIIGDCTNENLYNNFLFGSQIGIKFQNDGNGGASFHSVGNAVDGDVNTFIFEATKGDCSLINTQLVALDNGHSAYFFRTEPTFKHTVNVFSSNNWGGGDHFAQVLGGTVNYILASLDQSGDVDTFTVPAGSKFNLVNAYVNRSPNTTPSAGVTVNNAIFSPSTTAGFGAFNNVLPMAWKIKDMTSFKSRDGWHAYAFNDLDGRDENGNETIEDWRHAGEALSFRGIDGRDDTRWGTKESQNPIGWYDANENDPSTSVVKWTFRGAQWYAVDFSYDCSKTEHINAMILDCSAMTSNDGPAAWTLQVIDEENGTSGFPIVLPNGKEDISPDPTFHNWRDVARGAGAGTLLIAVFPPEDVKGLRMVQTGKKGGWWSIVECYTAMLSGVEGIEDIEVNEEATLLVANGNLVIAHSLLDGGSCLVEVFDMAGRCVSSTTAKDTIVPLANLEGMHIIRVSNAEGRTGTLKAVL